MSHNTQIAIAVRKHPVQARSTVTVEAIYEATIQVLLITGTEGLTTTRVAERAGVSVGTLYQYFPNKQSLLYAILEGHMNDIVKAVERACEYAHGKILSEMVADAVEAFVDAKMKRPDISTALYCIAAEIDGPIIVKKAGSRSRRAMEAMLKTAPDAKLHNLNFVIQMMFGAMAGATRSVLESGATATRVQNLRTHLVMLCQSYTAAAAMQMS